MRKLYAVLAVTVISSGLVLAAETKTITGEGKCAKCALKETKTCQNVIEVEEDGKTVKYYLAHEGASKKYHGTGEVEEKDGKKVMTATKVEKAK
jgi:hypothetical protein